MRSLLLTALALLTSTLTLACYPTSGKVGTSELLMLVQNKAVKPGHVPCAVFSADGTLGDGGGGAFGGVQAVVAVLRARGFRLFVITSGAHGLAAAGAAAAGFAPAEVRGKGGR